MMRDQSAISARYIMILLSLYASILDTTFSVLIFL